MFVCTCVCACVCLFSDPGDRLKSPFKDQRQYQKEGVKICQTKKTLHDLTSLSFGFTS